MSELMKDSVTAKNINSAELAERLQAHPNVLARVLSILDIIENQENNCETASGTELKIISELQKMGNDALQDWGNSQQKKKLRLVKNLTLGVVIEKSYYLGIVCSERYR